MVAVPNERALRFIIEYRNCPMLWDPKDPHYYRKDLKEAAWYRISANVNQPVESCKRRMLSLLASYRREKAKERRSQGTAAGFSKLYTSRWFAYEAFRFLEGRHRPRKRINAETIEMHNENEKVLGTNPERNVDTQIQSGSFISPSRTLNGAQTVLENMGNMETTATILKESASSSNDEITSFGNFVINKMMSYSSETRKLVEHAIFDVLVKADKGYYEQSFSTNMANIQTYILPSNDNFSPTTRHNTNLPRNKLHHMNRTPTKTEN